jgi:hypothetical protein
MTQLPFGVPAIPHRRIFVICPGALVTGGPELLHQLVHALVSRGRDAAICYTPVGVPQETPAAYRRYACPVVDRIPDEDDCAIIVPEIFTPLLAPFHRARHVVWWLSVDNYRGRIGTGAGWKVWLRRLFVSDIPNPTGTVHLFQSAYAREFVRRRFRSEGLMLSDYLASDFFEPLTAAQRRDAVAFNPSKGYAFTRALMRACPEIEFVRLQGLSRAEVRAALETCKVYIDFGAHPGKDRIPREAAMRGAVVVVGRQGSAHNDQDVQISARYKVEPGRHAVPTARTLIHDVFSAYGAHFVAQEPYREAIAAEPAVFMEQVRTVFGGTEQSMEQPR